MKATITIEVRFAWWLKPYMWLLLQFCLLHQTEPDPDKLRRTIHRAARFRIVRHPAP